MPKIPLTRIAAFRPFPAFLEANGCDVARRLRSFGIAAGNLGSEEALVPLPLAGEFVEDVARREGIDHFGLEAASRASMGEVGLFGRILGQSLSLKEMLEKVVRWTPALTSTASVRLEPVRGRPDSLRFVYHHGVAAGRPAWTRRRWWHSGSAFNSLTACQAPTRRPSVTSSCSGTPPGLLNAIPPRTR